MIDDPGGDDLLRQLLSLDPVLARRKIATLDPREFPGLAARLLEAQRTQRQQRQLLWYQPVSEKAMQIHLCTDQTVGIGGGNRSSKTESCLVELAMMTTGVIPRSIRAAHAALDAERGDPEGTALTTKFRGPIEVRVVCESLTTTLHQAILSKLQWWKWSGTDQPGGTRGHWGWIPRDCLYGGSWERAWSEKLRVLRVLCRDPENYARVIGESSWQFTSHDQDPTDFASGQFHYVLHDEPPRFAIWRENEARTISVRGRLLLAMTWPDDPTIPIDWIFDRLYEPAQIPGSGTRWINLWMTENPYIDQEAVELQRSRWDDQTNAVRVFGKPIRFSNRIHPLFTQVESHWCFVCGRETSAEADPDPRMQVLREDGSRESALRCGRCKSPAHAFSHVREFDVVEHWPTVFALDPHPRKPHMMVWVQVDPQDDLWVVAEADVEGDPVVLRERVAAIEEEHRLTIARRLIDPNMGRSPSSSTRRGATWQDDFDTAGLRTDLADDSDVGRGRINEYLKPDPSTLAPRLHIHPRCTQTIHQLSRYAWDDYRQAAERDQKQQPKKKYDDYPTLLKYVLNSEPSLRTLVGGMQLYRRRPAAENRVRGPREGRWQVRPPFQGSR